MKAKARQQHLCAVQSGSARETTASSQASLSQILLRHRDSSGIVCIRLRGFSKFDLVPFAEVLAALVELSHEVSAEASRGAKFTSPLNHDELAFYDAVAQKESAVQVQGEGILAQITRDLVKVMQRDVRTDWTVRDDVKAKLRSSVKSRWSAEIRRRAGQPSIVGRRPLLRSY